MKVAYIAHPIGGDVAANLDKVQKIVREINLLEPDVIPFAHYFVDCHALDDNVPEERERGIKNDIALMKKGFIDEVRLYGDRISTGMAHEVKLAHELGIRVTAATRETNISYANLLAKELKSGDKIWFRQERYPYTVRVEDGRFFICTKPFNPKKTVLYTIIDFKKMIRGTEDLIFCAGFETDSQCNEALIRFQNGESKISRRNYCSIDLNKIQTIQS